MDALPGDNISGWGWAFWPPHSAASPVLLCPALRCAASQAARYQSCCAGEPPFFCVISFLIQTAVCTAQDQPLRLGFSCADIPINIVIKDVKLPTLELVDLPGLCAHPPALRQQSHALVQQYLSREDTMVLCVVPASEPSISNSEAVHMIEEARKLQQTILALTMVRAAMLQAVMLL